MKNHRKKAIRAKQMESNKMIVITWSPVIVRSQSKQWARYMYDRQIFNPLKLCVIKKIARNKNVGSQ